MKHARLLKILQLIAVFLFVAIAAGRLSRKRLQSYQKLQREQQRIEQRQDSQAQRNSKQRWKPITKTIRQRPRP